MGRFALVGLIAGTIALASIDAPLAQSPRESNVLDQRLGSDPLFAPPDSLGTLVKQAPAAVIGEVVEPGELKLEEVMVPRATSPSVFGYALYRVMIRDVVYNRLQVSAPPLVVGSEVELTQRVGREGAGRFMAKQIPLAAGDECLLFLWPRPHGWGILDWPLQFRKSQRIPGTAEGLGPPGAMAFLGTKWLGGTVPFALDGDLVHPEWEALVTEVRRLGKQP